MTSITARATPTRSAGSDVNRWFRAACVAVIVALTVAGCTSPTVVEGTTVTVATTTAMFSLNDQTSYGNSPANSGVLQATNSSFNRYDDSSMLDTDTSFGSYQLLSNDPLTVRYTIAQDVTWSDGVPVDAADLLLAWVANSGTLNSDVDDSRYRDDDTGHYAEPFPPNVVYFDGATSAGLQYVTATPKLSDDFRSLTLTWDSYVVDWPLLLHVGVPAHVVAAKAWGMPLESNTTTDEVAEQPSVDEGRLSEARAAKDALIRAIQNDETEALSALANFWNSGFNVDAMPDDEDLLISTGPYVITDFVAGERVTLTANSRYHGDHSPIFETVVVRFLADTADQLAALTEGSVDVVVPRASSDVITALDKEPLITRLQTSSGSYEHIDLRFTEGKHSTFQDPRVREAFLKTIPAHQIRNEVLGTPLAASSRRSSLVFIPGEPDYREALASNGSPRFAAQNVAAAQSLLDDAGVTAPQVCIMFDPTNPKRVNEFQLIADAAALAGFVVTNCSSPDWLNLLGTPGSYDAAIFAWDSSNTSVAGLQSLYGTEGLGNLNGYSNPEVDALLAQLAVTPDHEAQQEIRTKIDGMLYADAYGLPLYQEQIVVAHNSTLTGPKPATLANGILWNIWEWAPLGTENAKS